MADREEPRGVEFWLAPYLRDSTLWPVTTIVVAIAALFVASALLLALEGNPWALAAVALLFWIGVDACLRARRRGRGRALFGVVAALWLVAVATAAALRWAGWF